MISRLAGAGCVLLTVFAVAYALGIARSSDSDLKVGVIGALPLLALAVALGLLSFWTRNDQHHSE